MNDVYVDTPDKLVMPKKLLKKWLAALRSGKYKQTKDTLYNPDTKGFCCLGVLEHCALNGQVEVKKGWDGKPYHPNVPSREFYKELGITMPFSMESVLTEMNDGDYYKGTKARKFKTIANFIEANSVGV